MQHIHCATLTKRKATIPGLDACRYYDIVPGAGQEAKVGARVAVHYDVKFR